MQGGGNENTKIIRQFYVVWSNSPLSMIFRMDKFCPLTKYATTFEQPKLQTLPLNSAKILQFQTSIKGLCYSFW